MSERSNPVGHANATTSISSGSTTGSTTGSNGNSATTTTTDMIVCSGCGREVPRSNLPLHEARACVGRRARPSPSALSGPTLPLVTFDAANHRTSMELDSAVSSIESAHGATNSESSRLVSLSTAIPQRSTVDANLSLSRPTQIVEESSRPTTLSSSRREHHQRYSTGTMESPIQIQEDEDHNGGDDDDDKEMEDRKPSPSQLSQPVDNVIHIDDDDEDDHDDDDAVMEVPAFATTTDRNDVNDEEVWSCPMCTLQNSYHRLFCDACHTRRPNTAHRPPDPVRTERLIQPDSHWDLFTTSTTMPGLSTSHPRQSSNWETSFSASSPSHMGSPSPSSSLGYLSGGALFGGVLGAAGAYLQGHSMSTAAMRGAMSGAIGGVVLQEIRRQQEQEQHQHLQRDAGADHSDNNSDFYYNPYATDHQHGRTRTAERRRQRRPTTREPPHNSFTILSARTSANPFNRSGMTTFNTDPRGMGEMENLLRVALMGGTNSRRMRIPDIDRMNYEQLLEMFGDGSEYRGADEQVVQSLPTAIVTDPTQLPSDHAQCMICLETFQGGQQRKTLPCLHGFHTECVDKWLRTNATCPICKFDVRLD